MKSRIESALRTRLTAGPTSASSDTDQHLRRQLALVEHANVSTVHGFCHRLLRQHFHRLGLDPNFRVLDADEAALLRTDVARELFLDRYEQEDAGQFQRFIDAYGGGNDDRLMAQVIATHSMLCSVVDAADWVRRARDRIAQGAAKPLADSPIGQEFLGALRAKLLALKAEADAALASLKPMGGFAKYVEYCQYLHGHICGWLAAFDKRGYAALVAAIGAFDPGRMPSLGERPGRETANSSLKSVQEQCKSGQLLKSLRFTAEQLRQGLADILPHAEMFLELVEQFGQAYSREKDRIGGVDFSDLRAPRPAPSAR